MRAREFIDEMRRGRNLLPTDPKAIELYKQQYELLKKRAEWLGKRVDVWNKLDNGDEEDAKVVKGMAKRALSKRTGKRDVI